MTQPLREGGLLVNTLAIPSIKPSTKQVLLPDTYKNRLERACFHDPKDPHGEGVQLAGHCNTHNSAKALKPGMPITINICAQGVDALVEQLAKADRADSEFDLVAFMTTQDALGIRWRSRHAPGPMVVEQGLAAAQMQQAPQHPQPLTQGTLLQHVAGKAGPYV